MTGCGNPEILESEPTPKLEELSEVINVETQFEFTNQLINESSPYLQQHAHNPVNWYPYSQEAFDKARDENKLIFLSIGYSTCHWCHVMNRESFEDEDVARVLNTYYIAIKVDREERPDIDNYYMNLYQLISPQGGWPLNVILTPDQKMFFGSTYLPKKNSYSQTGLIETLSGVQELWLSDPNEILTIADNIESYSDDFNFVSEGTVVREDLLEFTMKSFQNNFDPTYGGFSIAPKFPSPHYLNFILNHGSTEDFEMVYLTLTNIIKGGVHDQLAGGFHRYAVDPEWHVPHFEKMLYDQANLISTMSRAYMMSTDETFNSLIKSNILRTIDFVENEMSTGTLFYSAMDAETEEEEGKFYIWSTDQLKEVLTEDEFQIAAAFYSLNEDGNYIDEVLRDVNGFNILYETESLESIATQVEMDTKQLNKVLSDIRDKLLETRNKRISPHIDRKILTDWNAMYISSLFKAADALSDTNLLFKAEHYLESLDNKLSLSDSNTFELYHSRFEDQLGQLAFLDDYAYLLTTYLDAYNSTLNLTYLEKANILAKQLIELYWSDEYKGFVIASGEHSITATQKVYIDAAYPSGYSTAIVALGKLGLITGNTDYNYYATEAAISVTDVLNQSPFAMLQIADFVIQSQNPSIEIVIVEGEKGLSSEQFLDIIRCYNTNNPIILVKTDDNKENLTTIAPFTRNYRAINGMTTVYVCENTICKLPVSSASELDNILQSLNGSK